MTIKQIWDNWIVRNLILAVAAVLVFVTLVSIFLSLGTQHGKEIEVPDFTNLTWSEARKVASDRGVRVILADSVYVKRLKPGVVYLQTPEAGAHVKRGRRVRLTTNTLVPKEVEMPSLVGYSMRQAKAELARHGLTLGRLIYTRDIATNSVLHQQRGGVDIKPGTVLASGTTINLVLGLNPSDNMTYVPKLIGKQYLPAVDQTLESSLNVGKLRFDETVRTYADSVSAFVYQQRPAASEKVRMGTEVTLSLTTDPAKVPAAAKK
ncbi:MAG: PASTA domain-containing protein [Bacteroidales bacterium]|nr:PASTA domain-containing protein [Bacteroidales bacterium]MBR6875145.1 PASTA domain-containing protein [Bacteroidales bacterium]